MSPISNIFVYTFVLFLNSLVVEAARLHEDSSDPDWAKLAPSDGYDPTKDKGAQEMRPASGFIFVEDYDELRLWAREGYRDSQDKLVQRFEEGVLNLDKNADLGDFWEWEDLEHRILTQPGYLSIINHYFKDEGEDKLPGLRGRLLALLDSAPTDPLSQYILGYCYNFGLFFGKYDTFGENDTEAARWYLRAAEQEHALAQFSYGVMCSEGRGVPRNTKEGANWYLRAAKQDLALAQTNYGFVCYRGRGVPQNDEEAARWWVMAAKQGCAKAQSNYGWMCEEGRKVPQSNTEAARWYLRAAQQDLATAQYNYGLMCREGRGVPKNTKEAKKWLEKAAAQGDEEAKQKLRELT